MTLTEGFVRDELFIDFGSDIVYGCDQCCDSYPCVFPTVEFALLPDIGLEVIADRMRVEKGFKPMYPIDEYTEDTRDQDVWYDFYVGLNGYTDSHLDSCIEFIVVNSSSPDNEQVYTIDLTDYEQECIYERLDEQCRRYLGMGCEELLDKAVKEMEDVNESNKKRWT